ncbi:hypothetical protein Bca52824_029863 [Brassica carinata]|uniref:Cytochrome P450 n=1 Tax=Brassica carinata TaxID=52824 RepID=A0A8X7S807_BRACI|nr:hypothetical protein Bca52824_029863 [Brassica carinata]
MSTNSSYYLTFSDGNDPLLSRRLFLLGNVQVLELLLALLAFIAIHSLRQKKHYGLPVWPFLGMLPSLAFGLRGNIYELLTDVLLRQNGTFRFRGPCSSPIDLQDVLLRLTFDNVCMIAFGVDPGCLGPNQPVIPFAKAFEDATEAAVCRFVMPTYVWKLMKCFNLGTEKMLKESIKGVDDFADEVIRTRKKELSLEGESTKRTDLLTVFMGLRDEKGDSFSDKFLRDICVNFILAGRDTSSVALGWFFWLLEKNPEVEEKIMVEMCKILRQRDDNSNGGKIDYEPVLDQKTSRRWIIYRLLCLKLLDYTRQFLLITKRYKKMIYFLMEQY